MLEVLRFVACSHLSCQPSCVHHPTAMADLPRWVQQSDVDSSAMLNAFLRFHKEASEALQEKHGMSYQPFWEGQLWSFKHRDPPGMAFPGVRRMPMPLRIPQLPCRERACNRCGVRGGFVFRWYSPYWARHYNDLRRPGSWRAPQPAFANLQVGERYWLQHEWFWSPVSDLL